jgi:hypothetical protein
MTLKELEVDRIRFDQYLAWLRQNKEGKPVMAFCTVVMVPVAHDPYPLRYNTEREEVTHMTCKKKGGKKGCKK